MDDGWWMMMDDRKGNMETCWLDRSTWWLADWLGQQHGISDRRGICSLLTLLYENDGSSRLGHLEPKGRIPRWRPLGGQQEDYIYTGSGGEGRSRHHPEGRHARKHLNSEFGYTHASSRLIWPCFPSSRQQLSLHVRTSLFIPGTIRTSRTSTKCPGSIGDV
jgi:hypothetical protein